MEETKKNDELTHDDFKEWMDHEDEHFRGLIRQKPFVPEGLDKNNLVKGLEWLHEEAKRSKIIKYRQKLDILFKMTKSIYIYHIKDEIPSMLFADDTIGTSDLAYTMNKDFLGKSELIKREYLEPTADNWKKLFSIKAEWLLSSAIGDKLQCIDHPALKSWF